MSFYEDKKNKRKGCRIKEKEQVENVFFVAEYKVSNPFLYIPLSFYYLA